MIEFFTGLLGPFLQATEQSHARLKERSEALSALKEALRLTKKHVAETREDFGDIESRELAEKWSKAANLVRPFDAKLAKSLEHKSDYWTLPYEFKRQIQDGERRFDFRFRISEVEKRIREIENRFR